MNDAVQIDTGSGVVRSTSSVLAEAMAELLAAEYRAGEDDLLDAVALDLQDDGGATPETRSAA